MQPDFAVNYLAVLACAVAAMPVGFLWFGPMLGKPWAKEMGLDTIPKPDGAAMGKSMGLFFLGNLLIAYVLAHTILVWQPKVWGLEGTEALWTYGLYSAVFTWIGFFVPLQLGRVAWEFKGFKLVAINASHDLTRLLIFGMILAYWV